jgi:hypothetical protein
MEIAGIAVDRLADLELADRLLHAGRIDTAALVLIADAVGDERVGLDIRDRDAIIDVLGDTPDTDCNFLLLGALAACVGFWVLVALTVQSLT